MLKQAKHLLERPGIEPSLVGFGNLIAAAIGGVFWLLLATIVPVSDYGQLNYYISLSTILSTVSLLGLNVTIMTFLPKGEEKLRAQSTLLIVLTNAIIILPLIVITENISLGLMLLGTSFFTMTVAEILGRKKYTRFPLTVVGQRVAQFIFSITLYYLLGINGVLLGYGISLLLFSYDYLKKSARVSRKSITPIVPRSPSQKTTLTIGRPSIDAIKAKSKFIGHAFSNNLAQSLTGYADKLIIAPLFGFSVLGLYQIGFQFLVFLAVIPVSLTQYLIPQESSGIERKGVRKAGLTLAVLFATVLFFGLPLIVNWLFPAYAEAVPSAQIMILGVIPMTLTAIINAKLLGTERSKLVLSGSIVYLTSLFALLYVLGNAYHLIGLATALVSALSLQCGTLFVVSRRVNK